MNHRAANFLLFCVLFMALTGFVFSVWLKWISPDEIGVIWILLGVLTLTVIFIIMLIKEFIGKHKKKVSKYLEPDDERRILSQKINEANKHQARAVDASYAKAQCVQKYRLTKQKQKQIDIREQTLSTYDCVKVEKLHLCRREGLIPKGKGLFGIKCPYCGSRIRYISWALPDEPPSSRILLYHYWSCPNGDYESGEIFVAGFTYYDGFKMYRKTKEIGV